MKDVTNAMRAHILTAAVPYILNNIQINTLSLNMAAML